LVNNYQKLNPKSLDVFLKAGYFYLYLGEFEKAENMYSQADSIYPGNKSVLLNLGIVAQKQKNYSKAIKIFNSIKDEKEYKNVYVYIGKVYLQKEEPEKALEIFRKRVKISRDEDDPIYSEALKGIRNSLEMIKERENVEK
ncbi:MAG: tetratricopeptide repeat protein, partial [Calditrichia bacterium]|nr:tetratricopeptide repeat protein [Calditrichia bacterium]